MSINLKKFSPRPGLVNKQGRLPDPSELVCVEIPKVFDQCLIKRCLVYCDGPDTDCTDCELRSDPLKTQPKRYIRSRDFNIKIVCIDKIPVKGSYDYKKLVISYVISFYADFVDCDCNNQTEFYEINRTDTISKFYCPDSIAQVSSTYSSNMSDNCEIKLEMVADALDGDIVCDECGDFFIDITLGYYIVVKCELLVQLLIPAYDYCPVPYRPCEEEPEEDPCEKFEKAPIPKFYPDQKLDPLFNDGSDIDCDIDCDCECECEEE
ncbi:MAG: hypothetical protein GX275_13055 [Clostridiales bacterium]|nr:hypothetical protein [Clostridiales bacterium]